MAVIIDPKIAQRQGLVDSIDFLKGQIEITQKQLAAAERSVAFNASIGQTSPAAASIPGYKAEIAKLQAGLASEQQALQQFDSGTTGATTAPEPVPAAASLAPNETVVDAPLPVGIPVPAAASLAPNETVVDAPLPVGIPAQTAEEARNEAAFLASRQVVSAPVPAPVDTGAGRRDAGGVSFPSTNNNTTAAMKALVKSQGTLQSRYKQPGNGDWRVRLSLAPNSDYLYNAKGAGVLAPLTATNGVIFPYTPNISTSYTADYEKYNLIHSNYRGVFYKSSGVGDVQIRATFTAQDTREAAYLLAVIHFFRSVTKMFYGQDAERGTPPPLVYLSGYGDQQFSNHACVVSSFNYSLPNEVDYIRTNGPNNFGPNMSNRQTPVASSFGGSNFSGAIRLANALLNKGAIPQTPASNALRSAVNNTNECTYVPTKMEIDITLIPVQTRSQVSKQFSLKEFANGNLLKKGFW